MKKKIFLCFCLTTAICFLPIKAGEKPSFLDINWSLVTSMPTESEAMENYYVFVCQDYPTLVMGISRKTQNNAYFINGGVPNDNPNQVWMLDYRSEGKYVMKNYAYENTPMSSPKAWDFYPVANSTYEYSLNPKGEDDIFYLKRASDYVGTWAGGERDANYVDEARTAANIGVNDVVKRAACFNIYACPRANYMPTYKTSLENATEAFDASDFISNSNFSFNNGWGWCVNATSGSNNYTNNVGESFNQQTCIFSQTITGLRPGSYTVGLQGFYRPGDKRVADITTSNVALFVNNIEQPLENIYNNGISSTSGFTGSWLTVSIDGTDYYCPDNTSAANYAFNTLNLYKQTIDVVVTDGTLNIGMRKTGYVQYDWICFDNFTLTYNGFDRDIYESNLTALKVTAASIYERFNSPYISESVKSDLAEAKDITVANNANEEEYLNALARMNSIIDQAKADVVNCFKSYILSIPDLDFGFEPGQYAPYSPYVAALTEAKAVAVKTTATYDEVADAIDDYNAVDADPNATEVNGFRWSIDDFPTQSETSTDGSGGFTYSSSRISHNSDTNSGLNQLRDPMCLQVMANGSATYGTISGYTLPLKGNTVYALTFAYAGWGNQSGTPSITIKNDNNEVVATKTLETTNVLGNNTTNDWPTATVKFLTGEAGNYTIVFGATNNRVVFGDLSLLRAKAEEITLAETDITAPYTPNYANVTLNRTLSSEYWNTFCLPFEMTAEQITEIFGEGTKITEYESEDAGNNTVYMKNVMAIKAGVPYLIKPAGTVTDPVVNGVILNQATGLTIGDKYKFIGVIQQTEIAAGILEDNTQNFFLNTSGLMVRPSNTGNLKGMRAYFNIPVAETQEGVKIRISEDDEATCIDVIDGRINSSDAAVYNISGIRMNPGQLKEGIYIVDGKKVVIKNNK